MVVAAVMSSVGSVKSTDSRRDPSMDTNIASDTKSSTVRGLYDKLEDRCLMRDHRVRVEAVQVDLVAPWLLRALSTTPRTDEDDPPS